VTDQSPAQQPNVLWICPDQQRFDTLGCYGNQFVRTPNIDRIAENGVVFSHFYTQSTICVPSRGSFLTGRYPRTTRLRQNGQNIPPEERLVTRLLADAGYICGMVGKLHITAGDAEAGLVAESRIDDGYVYHHWSAFPWGSWRAAYDQAPTNAYAHWLIEKGVPYPHRTPPFQGSKYVEIGIAEEHHQTTWCAEKAITFIEANAASDRPWLISVNPFAPHHPFDPPLSYLEPYLDRLDEIPLPNYQEGELENKPVFQQKFHEVGGYNVPGEFRFIDMDEHDHRLIRAAYWAMVDLTDAQVGRMMAALERTGQLENTLVILSSDHGEMLGDHGIYLKGPFFYEPAIRVPFIVSWPGGISGGRLSEALVEAVDIAPTLLDVAGLPRPPGMQGRSLWPLLSGEADLGHHREDVYSEYYNASVMFSPPDPRAYMTMLRTERHKLVVVHGMETGELYDLESDPNETHNRWDDDGYLGVKASLLKQLSDRMAWTVDPLPQRAARW
jgi:arylsulfatase A-like enzyme